jgi:hypothetical protein
LPPLAKFADRIARGYKTRGEQEILKILSQPKKNPNEKAIQYAFLLAIGKNKDTAWKYSSTEIELGGYLQKFAEKLLVAQSEGYDDALKKLIFATGSTEKIG